VKTEGTPPLNWSSLASIVLQTKLQNKKTSRGNLMKNYVNILSKKIVLASFVGSFGLSLVAQEIEEVVVTAEKRSENLQDISQAVTALTESDIEEKKHNKFCRLECNSSRRDCSKK
jgi:hypothetical protein